MSSPLANISVYSSSKAAVSSAYRKRVQRTVPLGHFGKPEEVAAVVAFLASDEDGFVTGSDWLYTHL